MDFNQIPSAIRVPDQYFEIDNSEASSPQSGKPKTLLIGQRLSTGTATVNVPKMITSKAEAITAFGRGSMLSRMCDFAIRNNPFGELWALPVDDNGAGVKATGTVTITGAATGDGTIALTIADQLIETAVSDGDTANAIAAALTTAINRKLDLPLTAVNTGAPSALVTLTARHKGYSGSDITLIHNYLGASGGQSTPAGVGVALSGPRLTDGTTAPSLTSAITAMGDVEYDYIGHPYTDTTSLDALEEELNNVAGRWGPLRQVYGHMFSALRAAVADLSTEGNLRNGPAQSIAGIEILVPNPSWEVVGAIVGRCAQKLENAPARPVQNVTLIGIDPTLPASSRYTITERNTLLYDGIATLHTTSGGAVQIERMVTNYQTNDADAADDSYLDVETRATSWTFVRRLRTAVKSKYPDHSLVDDGTQINSGVAAVTPRILRGLVVSQYALMEGEGLVENAKLFDKYLRVERSGTDPNRVDFYVPPDYANQFRIGAFRVAFRLQYSKAA